MVKRKIALYHGKQAPHGSYGSRYLDVRIPWDDVQIQYMTHHQAIVDLCLVRTDHKSWPGRSRRADPILVFFWSYVF